MRIKHHNIRRKLVLLLLITSCTALTLATLGFAVSDWFNSRAEVMAHLRSQAGILGNNSVGALTFADKRSASQTLSSLAGEDKIVGAYLFDQDKQLFAWYQKEGAVTEMVLPEQERGSIEGLVYVIHEVVWDQEVLGYLLITSDLSQWQGQQVERLRMVLWLFLLAVAVAVLLSNIAQRQFTRPILNLANIARKVKETRNYQLRAEKLSNDEIGELADDFNEMLNQIQLRDEELLATRAQLEDKVKERTSELVELTQQLEHQAFHDSLTGLANRASLDESLRSAINFAQRHRQQLAVCFLDLDRFKGINDALGHDIGDRLLVELSQRLRACLRASDTLARLGGDEFAILLQDTPPEHAVDVAVKIIDSIKSPVLVEGHSLQVTTSMGIAMYPDDGLNAATILKNADTAMYSAKESGRNQYCFFTQEMNEKTERRMLLENKLRKAVDDGVLRVHYQPKWDIKSHRLIGLEALVRWHDEVEGFISPAEFIPLAEDCGLIAQIDRWVMKTACQEILEIYRGQTPEVLLSVNFSPAHFIRDNVAQELIKLLEETGYPAQALELEITETLIASEIDSVYQQLSLIREQGVEISIDDFGIAYSSLSRLKQLPLNTLKIDRSFINDIGQDNDDEVIVRTIIDMAHNLNLKVVAEGVETQEQYDFIRRHNCDAVQGFLFSRPLPKEALAELLFEAPSTDDQLQLVNESRNA